MNSLPPPTDPPQGTSLPPPPGPTQHDILRPPEAPRSATRRLLGLVGVSALFIYLMPVGIWWVHRQSRWKPATKRRVTIVAVCLLPLWAVAVVTAVRNDARDTDLRASREPETRTTTAPQTSPPDTAAPAQEEPTRSGGASDLIPLDEMSIAFDGTPSRRRVQEALDPVMEAYGLPITDRNYERAGSALVTLMGELGTPEMEVLDCMSRQRSRWRSQGFANGAGYAAFTLSEVGSCDPTAAGT